VLRGVRTMGVRLEHHRKSALAIAGWLEGQAGVARVLHPALSSHPDHELWKRDFCGSSGIFSIVLKGGGQKQQHAFLDALKIFGLGYSWGGYESLAVPVWLGDRVTAKGPYDGPLIRLQIGLEDVGDLKADLSRALAEAAAV
jgi:cysteine-S-conjugate beta-lyase